VKRFKAMHFKNMGLNLVLVIFFIGYIVSTPAAASEVHIKAVAEAHYFSEAFTIRQGLNDLKGGEAPQEGNEAFGKLRQGIELSIDNYAFGIYLRRDTEINHLPETADFIYLDKNDLPFPDAGNYDIDLMVDHVEFIEFQYKVDWEWSKRLRIMPAISFLYAQDFVHGNLFGNVDSENSFAGQEYSWDIGLDYNYKEDRLLGRPNIVSPSGQGYTSHVEVQWSPSSTWQVLVSIQDIFSYIKWDDAPFTTATSVVNSSISRRQSAISGDVGYEPLSRRLNRHSNLKVAYAYDDNHFLFVQSEYLFGKPFNYFGADKETEFAKYTVEACVETRALRFTFEHQYLKVILGSDSYRLGKSRHTQLSIAGFYSL